MLEAIDHQHIVAGIQICAREMAADEPCAPGNRYFHGICSSPLLTLNPCRSGRGSTVSWYPTGRSRGTRVEQREIKANAAFGPIRIAPLNPSQPLPTLL